MSPLVIDTDVLSFIFRNDSRAALYTPHLFGQVLAISFQTRAEMLRGALSANWGERRRQQLNLWLRKYAVVHSSDDLCLRWAEALAAARRAGRPIAAADAWIAATALLLDVPLVTHNASDYAGVDGLMVISES
ncbi:MAG TPA: PIN domain-containing protein [Pyrinomonadaceae bacterium]|nr:PIN domain-containing protein [Pyrinomonadaceae bacterium]